MGECSEKAKPAFLSRIDNGTAGKKRLEADEILCQLEEIAERELIAESKDARLPELPETFPLSKEKILFYIGIWRMWIATGKRHLLSEIMSEPDEPWTAVFAIDNAFHTIKTLKKEQQDG